MPTPVSSARQCLTAEAARALDDAVGVARRRGHAQTTSLHAVSALLALPSSVLREACARARSSAYSPRLQFRALELCFGVALDRLPSSQASEEPPISNSLMAAIRRSQANQRRHPESFHLHQQQQQSCVKVELRQLILSILDDPVVSRVFEEAGFRSGDIKFAIIRPPPPLARYPRTRCPPLFLCNLTGGDSDPGRRSFSFPFSGFSGFSEGDENCKRIAEVLVRKKGRNPLLVGVCAYDAIRSFSECVERGNGGVLPAEISGLSFICIEKEVSEFITDSGSKGSLGLKFEELGRSAESCSRSGVVVNFGDLKEFIADGSVDAVSYVISQLTRLLELHRGNLWLMGAAASCETYLKFLTRFPSIEKDWDLHPLPINSLGPSMGGFYSRPHSLMESFVPFGGLFSTTSDMKVPSSNAYQSISRCHLCNEKYEQEVSAILKGGCSVSSNQYQSSVPSWLQVAEPGTDQGLDVGKAKDDGSILDAKVMELQRKWNDICRRLHYSCTKPDVNTHRVGFQGLPGSVGFPFVLDSKERTDNQNSNSTNTSMNESVCGDKSTSMSMDMQRVSAPKPNMPGPVVPKTRNENFLSKLQVTSCESEHLGTVGVLSAYPSSLNMPDGHASPSSATSVTTDLGLGSLYASDYREPKKLTFQAHKERLQDLSGCYPAKIDVVNENISNCPARSPSSSGPDLSRKFDSRDFKDIWRVITEKVGWQDEAVYAISQTVARCRTENERRRGASLKGDIWFSFLGPDRVAKKRIAMALAEIIFGSRENLICVDLCSQDGIIRPNMIFNHPEANDYDVKFRGKTVVDFIACELRRKPLSVVFLENIDKADLLAQHSLSQAIKTGKFPDSHGREISINNTVFVTTSRVAKGNKTFSGKETINFSEERILGVQSRQMQILVGGVHGDATIGNNSNVLVTPIKGASGLFVNKRKMIDASDPAEQLETMGTAKRAHKASTRYLDLNLPVEESEENEADNGNYDSDSVSENSEAWLEDFFDQMDENIIFKPFDFDALANKIVKEISESFRKTAGSNGLLEIDTKVMEQILAAAWSSDLKGAVEDWVNSVLGRCFAEARQRYSFSAQSVLKLVTCEGLFMEEQASGICLPARIILN